MIVSKPTLRVIDGGASPAPDDAPSFEELFRRYGTFVAYLGNRLLGYHADVEDLVQDVFLVASQNELRGSPDMIRWWLKKVAVRKSMNRLRWRRVRHRLGLRSVADPDAIDPAADPETRTLIVQLHRILDSLPVTERVAWVLRHQDGESLDAVATITGCSLATAKRRIKAAHDKIREAMGDD